MILYHSSQNRNYRDTDDVNLTHIKRGEIWLCVLETIISFEIEKKIRELRASLLQILIITREIALQINSGGSTYEIHSINTFPKYHSLIVIRAST